MRRLDRGVNDDLRLSCTDCPGLTPPAREHTDPDSVVRCHDCGKKHSRDSLRVVPAPD
jgi:ribosomal protein L44E